MGLSRLLSKPIEDIYYLVLGINDVSLGLNYLGTLSDITQYKSKEFYADSFYGNYGRIIENIKEHAPNSKLIIFTMVNNDNLYLDYNRAIIELANYYNIPYIEQYDDDFFKSDIYLNMSGSHPRAIAYSGMCNAFERLIKKCIINNFDYFKDYYMY